MGAPSQPVRLAIKAVPGARRDEIVGALGDRLKVRISAPPEDGRANAAICALIAAALGLRHSQVRVVSGASRAAKVLEIDGTTPEAVRGLFAER